MTANPLTSLAGITVIKELERLNVHDALDKASDYFMRGIADLSEKYDVPAIIYHHSSILHIDVSGVQHVPYCIDSKDPQFQSQLEDAYMNYIEFSMALAAEGLIIMEVLTFWMMHWLCMNVYLVSTNKKSNLSERKEEWHCTCVQCHNDNCEMYSCI